MWWNVLYIYIYICFFLFLFFLKLSVIIYFGQLFTLCFIIEFLNVNLYLTFYIPLSDTQLLGNGV